MENEDGLAYRSNLQQWATETSSSYGVAAGSITGLDTFVLDYKVGQKSLILLLDIFWLTCNSH